VSLIPAKVTVFNDALLKIDAHNYETSVDRAALTPNITSTDFDGIGGNTITTDVIKWTLETTGLQDWDTENSFSLFCERHVGEAVSVDLYAREGGKGRRFTIKIVPGVYGGTSNEQLKNAITFKVLGQPVEIDEVGDIVEDEV